jgi:REP element-mobilizing transposase RayT
MSRPLRIEYKNAYYHVMNRGRGRKAVFHDERYYAAFYQGLSEAHQRFGLEIHAWCLMGNHYHLLVRTPRGNLSRAMRHVNGLYTQRYNRLKHTDGPLFRGRYKAILIDANAYLLQVSRYIHRNPIETKQPLVSKLERYPWSSYPAYIQKQTTQDWLYRNAVYGELGSPHRYAGYRRYVENGNDKETSRFYDKQKTPAIWGDQDFVEKACADSNRWHKEVTQGGMTEPIAMEDIVRHVAQYYQCSEQDIFQSRRGRGSKNLPRWMAMKLCQDYSGQSLANIAKRFGVGNYCTVSQTIARLNHNMEEDVRIRKQLITISKDLTP